MADLKLNDNQARPGSHTAAAINGLLQAGMQHFRQFIKSFEKDGRMPDRVDEAQTHSFLMAHFSLARMWSKLVTTAVPEALANLEKTKTEYKFLIDYFDNNHVTSCFQEEIEICRQMHDLLPVKINAIMHGAKL
ncbi:putative KIF-1 binding protein C terminal [Paratrimastix pyriformis]|uniref:KIF-binding protein n=1 Tax=Paratrimastix pyriformis TaxID=342808 RepID=A0ABQ8UHW1_9EUKA|nr:putative KIF-1 binding protein C terminal [Paratrimastix pyriformis]